MSLEPENECPSCGEWKGESYELCRDCSADAKEEREEPVEVKFHTRVKETDKAILFKLKSGFTGESLWVPKSILIEEFLDTFSVPRWWAEDNDLAYQDE